MTEGTKIVNNQVRIERAGNRILLASDYPTSGLKEDVPGAYFRKDGVWSVPLDLTTCHLLRERFGQRLVIGPALTVWARAEKAQRSSQAATAAATDAELTRLPEVAPVLFAAMSQRKYQKAAVEFVTNGIGRDGRRRALIGDTVGLGKTLEAIGAVLESGVEGPYLVVCPKTAVEVTWAPEVRQWLAGTGARVVTLPETKQRRDSILTALAKDYNSNPASLRNTWLIVHPAAVRTQTWWICMECAPMRGEGRSPNRFDLLRRTTSPAASKYKAGMVKELECGHMKTDKTPVVHEHTFPQLFTMQYGAVIADESDQILIRKTATPNLQRRGMEMLADRVRESGCKIAMSGTPFRSKPHQIWSTLNWLDSVRWSAKWSFLEKFWKVSKGGYGGSYSIGELIEGREDMLNAELSDVMIRRTREQVRGDLPPKNYPSNVQDRIDLVPGIYLPMTAEQERYYRSMEKEGEAAIEGGTLTAIGVLAEYTRLKQFAGAPGILDLDGRFVPKAAGNKYEWILEFMEELGLPDRPSTKIVIASQFTSMLNAFAGGVRDAFGAERREPRMGLGTRMGMITGESRDRKGTWEMFETPDSGMDVLWINTKAGGSAITLDAADVMVLLDETWVDDEQQQLEGRIDNRQPERRIAPRSYYYLRSFGTVEESIARRNAEAKAASARLLDGGAFAKMGVAALKAGRQSAVFLGGPERKIRRCRECGVVRNQYHVGNCNWDGD